MRTATLTAHAPAMQARHAAAFCCELEQQRISRSSLPKAMERRAPAGSAVPESPKGYCARINRLHARGTSKDHTSRAGWRSRASECQRQPAVARCTYSQHTGACQHLAASPALCLTLFMAASGASRQGDQVREEIH